MIVVTGDVVLDHNIYEGERLSPDSSKRGARYGREPGGATLVYGLLEKLLGPGNVRLGLKETTVAEIAEWPDQFHSRALWHAVEGKVDGQQGVFWSLNKFLGYGDKTKASWPATRADAEGVPKVLVLDDGGLGFRHASHLWPAYLSNESPSNGPEWIVLKMSPPFAGGDLWKRLTSWRERLIVIASADHLRREGGRVAGGLSWETTVDDIIRELNAKPDLRELQQCHSLIVTLRSEAALLLRSLAPATDSSTEPRCQLIFDRARCEGQWEEENKLSKAYGFLSAMAASVGWFLDGHTGPPAQVDFRVPLAAGLSTSRFLRAYGHGPVGPADGAPSFPFEPAARHIRKSFEHFGRGPREEYSYTSADVYGPTAVAPDAADASQASRSWTTLGLVSPWHTAHHSVTYTPARRVAEEGPDKLGNVPSATFGKLVTLDRQEIDSLRTLRQLMLMYRGATKTSQPLSLAVFGAPGSGKSFGLKEIARAVFQEKDDPVLEFNLSQFSKPDELIGAFHQVRDKVLKGITPVVFWDEFDCEKLTWLKYFLAPMNDGMFQEGQITHGVGKSVFVFAGGTCQSFSEFERQRDDKAFIDSKGPDFISRLSGYLDVAGPNQRNKWDLEFPVRRAVVIRAAVKASNPKVEILGIEEELLTALLAAKGYRNGARSLAKLVGYIHDRGGLPLRRAYLPPDPILGLYVEDVPGFYAIMRQDATFRAMAAKLAPQFHDEYLRGLERADAAARAYAKPWPELSSSARDSNVAAALRMPEILRLAGLEMKEGAEHAPDVADLLEKRLEELAEAEHGGWEEYKRIDGWTYSNDRQEDRTKGSLGNPLLIPYPQLSEKEKDRDRTTIRHYPDFAKAAGFAIVYLRDATEQVLRRGEPPRSS
jgi:hypothetical protein